MAERTALDPPEFAAAYRAHERQQRINTGQVASALVVILMPVGVVLDYVVYPEDLGIFLTLRLMCAGLAAVLWYLHRIEFGQRHYQWLGLPIALLPSLFICWMIFIKEGAASPYYAGLNLVLLAVSVVVHWNAKESLIAVAAVVLMYVAACVLKGAGKDLGVMFNNLYFIALTGIIVITGNHLFNRLQFREFALRFELDQNRAKLEDSNRKLMELDEIKSRFFANISHELRTPLTLLIAPLETLTRRFHSAFDEGTRELLATMQSNGMRLLKLINDLLDLVRLESGQIVVKAEPMEVADFVRGLASSVRQVAHDKRINLETKVDPELAWVQADRDKLEKIILNLLFNALKFTPAGGRVSLLAEKAGDQYVLKVQDTGMGISEKNLANVFSRFWQADDSSRRKYQGVGIGLALVKELTEVQGGTVSIESQEGKGTTFTVKLPYVKAEPVEPVASPEAEVQSKGTVTSDEWLSNLYRRAELFPAMTPVQETLRHVETARPGNLPRVLVADDEPDMLRFLKSQLTGHYQVLEAVDGQQAIDKAAQFLPDIILLDMMMPEKDGLQACKELRQRTTTQSIPIILLTARADEETKLKALSAGASDFLPKPFSTTELHVRIKNLVDSYHFQRKLAKQNVVLEETIEQLKETETQLVQTEKLASLGRMSAGIIHEINNPLNFATTGLYTLKRKASLIPPEEQDEYTDILKDVEEGLSRVKTIVSDLRSFSHNESEMIEQVDAADVLTSALRFLSHELRDNVEIHQKLAENQTIWANKNKLIQVAVNLLQNSIDALKTKTFGESEKPAIWIEGRLDQGKSLLVFRDNGMGIESGNLDKIFDPFFTTKDVGQGMGLGLSICYRIVQSYEGRILVRSEPGKFCEFTLEFPVKGQT
ncbi:MAG TPA: ATP-binding protein [Verrucomicrobiae bacterium]|nr:ATP-binding protein [Verrucomicrobiae bacterium]